MLSQSFTAYLLTSLTGIFKRSINNSFFITLIYRMMDALGAKVHESRIGSMMTKDVFTDKYYSSSMFYTFFNSVIELVIRIIKSIGLWLREIFKNSLTLYLFDKISGAKWCSVDFVLALFVGLMFAAPHEVWNNLYAFLAAVFFVFWAFVSIASGKLKRRSITGVNASIIGFITAVILSTVTAIKVSDALRIGIFMLSSVMLCYCVYVSVDTKEKLMRFLKIVLAFVSITAVLGIVQRLMGIEVDPEFVDTVTNKGMPGRVFSTFANPNNFAELLLLFLPFFVPVLKDARNYKERFIVLCGFAVTVTALVMTYSRSCWVGFALAALLFIILYDKRLLLPFAVVVIMAIPLLPETVMNRIFTIGSMRDTSNSYRLYIWESALMMIRDFGSVGLGLGPASFKSVYMNYADQVAITAPHSHMLYMEIIIEMGILGFVTFMGYMYSVVKKTVSSFKRMDSVLKSVGIAGLSALFGIAFVCCAEYIWFYPRVMFAFWIIPGLMLAASKIAKE